MKIIGIIVEFNPFHKGHLNYINKIKEKYEDSLIIAVMSGNVVQRGEFSIFDKYERAKVALENNVDIVVQLQSYYVLNNANIFAREAIKILNIFNVEKIIFGSESNKINTLKSIANKMDEEEFKINLDKNIKELQSFPKAFLKTVNKKEIKSNDILGICYINEGNKINENIDFETIKRDNKFKSASETRKQIFKNGEDKNSLIKSNNIINTELYKDILFSNLISYNGDDSLLNYLKKKLIKEDYKTWEEFLTKNSNKTFTKKRISRESFKYCFNIKENKNYVPIILGAKEKGKKYLRNFPDQYTVKLISNNIDEHKINKIIQLKTKIKDIKISEMF